MNAAVLPVPATPAEGGYYAGRIRIGGVEYALIVSPKAAGEHVDAPWSRSMKAIAGAASYFDGVANTKAMADAGSALARWALDLRIGGFDDWYLPALDEFEICYRHLKPGVQENRLWARSGINLSAVPPTYPYTADMPRQTEIELFRSGGAEAFDEVAYWSSTQHESNSGYAWLQHFVNGRQDDWLKNTKLRARAVRRSPI